MRQHIYVMRVEGAVSCSGICQLRCLMTILDNYMFRPLLAIFRLSSKELKVLLYRRHMYIMGLIDRP